jgi:hypothetical protein
MLPCYRGIDMGRVVVALLKHKHRAVLALECIPTPAFHHLAYLSGRGNLSCFCHTLEYSP